MKKIGFIDYYLDEWHANNYPRMIAEASNGSMAVTGAFGLIDSPIGGRTTETWCREMNIPRFETIEALIADSDALIVLSPDNCEMHEQLCRLPLASGKPTYVDKTFAPDGVIARRIFAIAEESRHALLLHFRAALCRRICQYCPRRGAGDQLLGSQWF